MTNIKQFIIIDFSIHRIPNLMIFLQFMNQKNNQLCLVICMILNSNLDLMSSLTNVLKRIYVPALWILQMSGVVKMMPKTQYLQNQLLFQQNLYGNWAIFALKVYGYFIGLPTSGLAASAILQGFVFLQLPIDCFKNRKLIEKLC